MSLDAMGCQHRTAVAIAHAGADWLLALKGNQATMHQGAVAPFADEAALGWIASGGDVVARHEETDAGHGRVEKCCHWVMDVVFAEDQSQIRSGHAA